MKKFLLFFVALFAAINMNAAETTVTWTAKAAYDAGTMPEGWVDHIACGKELSFDFATVQGAAGAAYIDVPQAIRCYAGNSVTITSNRGPISKIEVDMSLAAGQSISADLGSFDNTTLTWEGSASAVKLTYGPAANGDIKGYLVGLKVTYDDNALTLAEAKALKRTSANKNSEFVLDENLLVTGFFGTTCFVEANGIGMQVSGINSKVAVGDIITEVRGTMAWGSNGAKNSLNATACTVVSSNNEVTPLEVNSFEVKAWAEELDARLIKINRVAIDETAASGGNFLMTVNADKNDTEMMLSITGTKEYVPVATIEGYVKSYTGAMAAMSSIMVKDIAGPEENELSLAEAKSKAVTSANRNTEYIIYDKVLITEKIDDTTCYVEANGVGMKIVGFTGLKYLATGDIITDIEGKLNKVSFGKNTFTATSGRSISYGNDVTPLEVAKDEVKAKAEELDARFISIKKVGVDKAASSDGNFLMTVNADKNDTGMNLSIIGTKEYAPYVDIKGYVTYSSNAAMGINFLVADIQPDMADSIRTATSELADKWNATKEEIADRYPQALDMSEFSKIYNKLNVEIPGLVKYINEADDKVVSDEWKSCCETIQSFNDAIDHLLFLIDVYETEDALADLQEKFDDITGDHTLGILIDYCASISDDRDEIADAMEEVAELIEQCKQTGEPTPAELKDKIAELSEALDQVAKDAMDIYPSDCGAYAPIMVEMFAFYTKTDKFNDRDGEIRGDLKLTNLWNRVMDQVKAEEAALYWDMKNNPEPSDLRLGFHYTNVALIYASFAIYDEAVKQHLTKDEKIQAIFDAILNLVSSRNKIAAQYGPVLDDNAEWQALSARLDAEEAAVNALEGTDPSIEVLDAHETEIAAINTAMQAFAAKMSSDATAISSAVKAESTVNGVYNLAGQKVSSNFKGIVVKNGKKVMVK